MATIKTWKQATDAEKALLAAGAIRSEKWAMASTDQRCAGVDGEPEPSHYQIWATLTDGRDTVVGSMTEVEGAAALIARLRGELKARAKATRGRVAAQQYEARGGDR